MPDLPDVLHQRHPPLLLYFHDPMCSWCWGFRPVLMNLLESLPESVSFQRILGGLAPDSDAAMPESMQQMLQETWRRIEAQLGTEFNHDFWTRCQPRRSTWPSCRAVLVAREYGKDEAMILAIQNAYYREARNPSDTDTLKALAEYLGMDGNDFVSRINSDEIKAQLEQEIAFSRDCGVQGFPTLALLTGSGIHGLPLNYTDPTVTLQGISELTT